MESQQDRPEEAGNGDSIPSDLPLMDANDSRPLEEANESDAGQGQAPGPDKAEGADSMMLGPEDGPHKTEVDASAKTGASTTVQADDQGNKSHAGQGLDVREEEEARQALAAAAAAAAVTEEETRKAQDTEEAMLAEAARLAAAAAGVATLEEEVRPDQDAGEVCRVCIGANSDEGNVMLLCHSCDAGYHQCCLDLPVMPLPTYDVLWYCPSFVFM